MGSNRMDERRLGRKQKRLMKQKRWMKQKKRHEMYMESVYHNTMTMLHLCIYTPGGCPDCIWYMEEVLGRDGAKKDAVYGMLNELWDVGYWDDNWAPLMDDVERRYLFDFASLDIEYAVLQCRTYILDHHKATRLRIGRLLLSGLSFEQQYQAQEAQLACTQSVKAM